MQHIEKIMENTKYPRTLHLPFSPGLQNDDRRVESGWEELLNNTLVLTEKLDGENSCMNRYNVFARSHSSPTRSPWSRNLWGAGGLHDRIKNKIGEDEYIYGENLYGIHSIEYTELTSYFHLFGVRNNNIWYSWDDVELMAECLDVPTVPVLQIQKFSTVKELEECILFHMHGGSNYGSEIEGVVVRNINSYPIDQFQKNVVKYVRKGHVQTDQFWAKKWKKANLIYLDCDE